MRASGATFTVINTNDSGAGSLRTACESAIANGSTADDIVFNIPGTGPHTIVLLHSLPPMNAPNTQVRADTQSGYVLGSPAVRIVPTPGNSALTNPVFNITVSNCVIRGFHISGFTNGAAVSLGGPGFSTVAANVLVNDGDAVYISGGQSNVIGGLAASERNVISSNTDIGVRLESAACSNILIAGNFIGTSPDGLSAWPNRLNGINLHDCPAITVRGTALAPQVISGNGNGGIGLSGSNAKGDLIVGNFIGVDVTGTQRLANITSGISIDGGAGATIGGTNAGERNVISGNSEYGVYIWNGSTGNVIQVNFIGLASDGFRAISNRLDGIAILDSSSNVVGGAGRGNFIGGNRSAGVTISGTNSVGNMIYGNTIGMGPSSNSLPNATYGVLVTGGRANRIGGTSAGEGNTIVNHATDAVLINGSNTAQNLVARNFIGLDEAGVLRGNGGNGVRISGSPSNQVGATFGVGRNVIGGNSGAGIKVENHSDGCTIYGNYVGLTPAGTSAATNWSYGVWISDSKNVAVGFLLGGNNVISGNSGAGVRVEGQSANTVIVGNYIGTAVAGTNAVPNNGDGINIASAGIRVGGNLSSERNVISGNSVNGVSLGAGSDDCQILGNYIGLNFTGTLPITNYQYGIHVTGSRRTIIGNGSGGRNVISASRLDGIMLEGASSNAVIAGNFIGTDATATNVWRNGGSGIAINTGYVTVGGTNASERNVIGGNSAGINVYNGTSVRVIGNYIGVSTNGVLPIPNYNGVHVNSGARGVLVGGASAKERNVIAQNLVHEVFLEGPTSGHSVLGNYIGLHADGTPFGATDYGDGVRIDNSPTNLVDGNTIGGCYYGVHIVGTGAVANVVRANAIGTGTNYLPSPAGHYYWGVLIENASSNIIGGTSLYDGNLIAYCGGGVGVTNSPGVAALGNLLVANLIVSNRPNPAIDLGLDGVTTNDAGDGDAGPNGLQNKPVITNAFVAGSFMYVQGSLAAAPLQSYWVDVYRADGKTEGSSYYLVRVPVATDASGNGAFVAGFSTVLPTGTYLSATATDARQNTSEFALTPTGIVSRAVGDSDGDGMPDYWENLFGLNPAVSNAPTADADGDGVPDRAEYIADTAANNPNVYFAITAVTNGAAARYVSFPTHSTRLYEIESITNLATPQVWTSLISGLPGNDGNVTWADSGTTTSLFFRVRASLPKRDPAWVFSNGWKNVPECFQALESRRRVCTTRLASACSLS